MQIRKIDYSSNLSFMNALRNGSASIPYFLRHGTIDPNFIDKYGASPLFYAIIHNKMFSPSPGSSERQTYCDKLIEMGADINYIYNANLSKENGKSNLLIHAARHRNQIFKKILDDSKLDINFKQDSGLSAAQACMRSGFDYGLRLLIAKGANIDSNAFNEVHKSHQWPMLALLVKSDVPYHENENGENLLHVIARQNKYIEVYSTCIRHLAGRGFINQLDKAQNTPLYYALQTNNYKMINQFILHGSDLSYSCQGVTLYDAVDKLLLELEGQPVKSLFAESIPMIVAGKMKNDLEKQIPLSNNSSSSTINKFKV